MISFCIILISVIWIYTQDWSHFYFELFEETELCFQKWLTDLHSSSVHIFFFWMTSVCWLCTETFLWAGQRTQGWAWLNLRCPVVLTGSDGRLRSMAVRLPVIFLRCIWSFCNWAFPATVIFTTNKNKSESHFLILDHTH